jgi:intron-binding protein aquarius
MMLEFSQYLENYLWKYFKNTEVIVVYSFLIIFSLSQITNFPKSSDSHVLSIVAMVNEKFRERVYPWNCFKAAPDQFPALFERVLRLCLADRLSLKEQTNLIAFLDNCINSLEVDLVRTQVQRICGLPMWLSLCANRREHEFSKFPKLRKFWKAIQKNDAKLIDDVEKEMINFQRRFLKNLLSKFISLIASFNLESGEIEEATEKRLKLNYLERFLEMLIDLEALLPTRKFFNALLDDTHVLIYCGMSCLVKDRETHDEYKLFNQLLEILKFYTGFEIDDQTGEALTEAEMNELHYKELSCLQKGVFKYFKDDLQVFSLTNIANIDKREYLYKFLQPLSLDRLYALADYLHLVPFSNETSEPEFTKECLIEILISDTERRRSHIDEINSMPLFPTEEMLWDENSVPTDYYSGVGCLPLPKLNLQFLTLHDYLLRNFTLFRLEAAYEIRQDIEDAIIRMRPYYSFEEDTTQFASWSRQALPIANFAIIEIGKANVGEKRPAKVRADVTLDLEFLKKDVRQEWESMHKYDIGFLITIRTTHPPEYRYDRKQPFVPHVGLVYVRGCEIEGLIGNDGKMIEEGLEFKSKVTGDKRTWRVHLDPNQYMIDTDKITENPNAEDVYSTFNVFLRRRPKEGNFKAVLESIRDLMNTNFVVPDWLRDIILGYGDPGAAHYANMKQRIPQLNWNDTFLSYQHLVKSFPDHKLEVADGIDAAQLEPPFRLRFCDLEANSDERKIIVQPYKIENQGPYVYNQPKKNSVPFTPTQIEAIKSGMQPGLTMVVGPPGTGKTDVAVQIISNIYHNFPDQKTLIVTHSNQALNQLFEKIMALDIDERHLLRLGHGEDELETEKDFSRYGRVNYVLGKRLELLEQVESLQKSLDVDSEFAYSCETSSNFYLNQVLSRWEAYIDKVNTTNSLATIGNSFPFKKFFENAPQPLFKGVSYDADIETAHGCFRYIKHIFEQLDEFRAFELMRSGSDRSEYLLVKEAKIVAMTCTHAALKRRHLVKANFKYDNILMEESAQILEIETFIPLLLQNPDHNGNNRLKRWIMIGDHHQLPPVVKNMAFQKYSNMEQSLFTRFVKLGVPTVDLDSQGRSRPSLCHLFQWRYKNLGTLPHCIEQTEFQLANAGFQFDHQMINVENYKGVGESEPRPFYYQNLAEAEYVTAVYMYMRLLGYPAERISVLTTYNGQKHLIRDVMRQRCGANKLIGLPKKVTTVDKYQGQQNDYILLSLVRTKTIGHLRDVRRLIVAMSRARLGLYIFGRVELFRSCFELTPAFNILLQRPTSLSLVLDEVYPSSRKIDENLAHDKPLIVHDMPQMAQFVFDLYKAKINVFKPASTAKDKQSIENKINKKMMDELDAQAEKLGARLNEGLEKLIEKNEQAANASDDSISDTSSSDEENERANENVKEEEPDASSDESMSMQE